PAPLRSGQHAGPSRRRRARRAARRQLTRAEGTLRIELFTIFPGLLSGYLAESVIGRARRAGVLDIRVHDLRSAATDPHRSVDDMPFGGGAGMVLAPEPIFGAVEAVDPARPLYLLSPSGRRFDQAMAHGLASLGAFSLL